LEGLGSGIRWGAKGGGKKAAQGGESSPEASGPTKVKADPSERKENPPAGKRRGRDGMVKIESQYHARERSGGWREKQSLQRNPLMRGLLAVIRLKEEDSRKRMRSSQKTF